ARLVRINDVTERRYAQEAARSSEERLRLLFELSRDSIVLADDRGKCVDVNPAAAKLFGIPTDRLTKMNLRQIPTPAGEAERFLSAVSRGMESAELRFVRADGAARIAEYSAQRIGPDLHLCILRDVTERKMAEDRERADNQRGKLHFEQIPLAVI